MTTGDTVMERETYPLWDTKRPEFPPRTRLFRLEPIGTGTAEVESLTSYIARLAAEHCVSPRRLLFNEVLMPAGKHTVYFSNSPNFTASQINSIQRIADTVVTAFERLTMRHDLRHMTLLNWGAVLSPNQLLRSARAWCALCYEEKLSEGKVIYDPLIWAFEIITVCPKHQGYLCHSCPRCGCRRLPFLFRSYIPGYCSACHEWLGTSSKTGARPSNSKDVKPTELARQVQLIDIVGELLSRSPGIQSVPMPQNFIANLGDFIVKEANHNINLFADIVGIWSGAVRRLLGWQTRLRLEVLCQLCSRLNVSPLDLLLDKGKDTVFRKRHFLLQREVPLPDEAIPLREVKDKLYLALKEDPPPSPEAVACRMGYYPAKLKRHHPELCSEIAKRYWEHRTSRHPPPKEIKKVLKAALKEMPPPSLQRVLRRLGCKDTGYYYYSNYPTLCLAVTKRFKDYRNKPFNKDRDRERILAALKKEPPPSFSEVARQLGHTRDFVRRKFPELSKAVASRYMHYAKALRKEKADRLRRGIQQAIQQLSISGLNASEARVKKLLKQHLPNLGRDSLFKQALREVKTELGLA